MNKAFRRKSPIISSINFKENKAIIGVEQLLLLHKKLEKGLKSLLKKYRRNLCLTNPPVFTNLKKVLIQKKLKRRSQNIALFLKLMIRHLRQMTAILLSLQPLIRNVWSSWKRILMIWMYNFAKSQNKKMKKLILCKPCWKPQKQIYLRNLRNCSNANKNVDLTKLQFKHWS